MEIMRRSGLAEKLSRLLRPRAAGCSFPRYARDRETMDSIAANVSANLLGLGNAATPLGLEAARRMSRQTPGASDDSLCMLVVCKGIDMLGLMMTLVVPLTHGAGGGLRRLPPGGRLRCPDPGSRGGTGGAGRVSSPAWWG